jgi:D-beta-D-heptose 7-phosphate kinase/D-beta-D-heptose 1-phosphate adenosyltransferase
MTQGPFKTGAALGTLRTATHNLTELALLLKDCSVFIVGDVLLDCYIHGSVSRLSPEAPVPVVLEGERRYVLGGAANVAANISSIGGRTVLCGRIGRDADGASFRHLCQHLGIETHALLESDTVPTIRKTRVLAGYQQLVRIDREIIVPLSASEEQKVLLQFERFLTQTGHKALVLSDYGKGMLSHSVCRSLIETARSHKIPIVTDPKSNDLSRYQGTTFIKPNLKEGRDLLKVWQAEMSVHHFEEEVDAICDVVSRLSGAEAVVLSLSEHGVALKESTLKTTRRFASRALQVADVSGAGDTMVAFLAMAAAIGASPVTATELANLAAALVCAKLGTATLTLTELLLALSQRHGSGMLRDAQNKDSAAAQSQNDGSSALSPKILQVEVLWSLSQAIRSNGRSIVFTNGCFDLLHMGHVDLLERCKQLGDVLVVGLNSDASIRRLKGSDRPIQTFESRSRVLAGLAAVDFVVGFEDDTPIELIRTLSPHVLVKGGDYTVETVVGSDVVLERGGRVEILPLIDGHSTSRLVDKARIQT